MANDLSKDANYWVFRDGRKTVSSRNVLCELLCAVEELSRIPVTQDRVVSALLRAGELEAALADADFPFVGQAAQLTDTLADSFCRDGELIADARALIDSLTQASVPENVALSTAEGFAYYALHPLDFVKLALATPRRSHPAAVIGIRSIGTTLSAIVTAALRREVRFAQRITVRPTGHPYNRVLQFTPDQLDWVHRLNQLPADFLVVDEGPGRSGSSFLSVGEALLHAGVPVDRIQFLGSRQAEPAQLCAQDADSRWNRFRFSWPARTSYERFSQHIYVGGGTWRQHFLGTRSNWPACWPQMERFKFLSPDKTRLFKFEGFGHFGKDVLNRADCLARTGFGPPAESASDGMICYPVLPGDHLTSADLSPAVLDRIAEYCAFRRTELPVTTDGTTRLPEMFRFNLSHAFGIELDFDPDLLATSNPVLADGHMQPHEWIRCPGGTLLKVDGCSHGDDHFFPGPTDIAWDLAGAMVEWNLNSDAADALLSKFHHLTGDDPRPRIPLFTLAYAIFRLAYCRMGRTTVPESPEEKILESAANYYRTFAERLLAEFQSGRSPRLKRVRVEDVTNYSTASD